MNKRPAAVAWVSVVVFVCAMGAWPGRGQSEDASSPGYRVIDLGRPGTTSEAEALNDQGQVVGWQGGGKRVIGAEACLWQNGSQRMITQQPYDAAYGINEAGEVVGIPSELHIIGFGAFDILSGASGFVWDRGFLSYLGGFCGAYAINDAGVIAGESGNHAVTWPKRVVTGLLADRPDVVWTGVWSHPVGQVVGYSYGVAYGLNNTGEVVGVALKNLTNAPENGRAFTATDGRMRLLMLPSPGNSIAYSVNNAGNIVGAFRPIRGEWWAVTWDVSGDATVLPLPPGDASGQAHGINADGKVVGWASPASDSPAFAGFGLGPAGRRACLWQDGKVYALNDLIPADSGWDLQTAKAINTAGWIVGGGTIHGEYHAFLLTPNS